MAVDGAATRGPGLSKYVVPEVVFGPNALAEIGHAARRLGAQRPMLVTDPGIVEAGWVAEALRHLAEVGLRPLVWSGPSPNPKDVEIRSGAQVYLAGGCDVIIAVGGGSCIDDRAPDPRRRLPEHEPAGGRLARRRVPAGAGVLRR